MVRLSNLTFSTKVSTRICTWTEFKDFVKYYFVTQMQEKRGSTEKATL